MTTAPFKLLRVRGVPVTDAQLIDDLRRVASLVGSETVSQPQYSQHGQFDMKNLSRRLGGWDAALSAANLGETSYKGEYSEERLFANILTLWQHFGRQPRRAELAFAPSEISQSPYNRKFRSWTGALEAFVKWANATDAPAVPLAEIETVRRNGPRDPSLRLRFRILLRDRFTCCGCGKSPATSPGTELHIDHIVPWSKGGETVFENLKTMCSLCNFGKGNAL